MADNEKKLGDAQYPDEETREIEEEIEEEEKREKDKAKSEDKTEVEEESEDKGKDSEKDKGKKDEEDEEESKDTSKINKRSIRSVPFGRFAKEKDKREKLETELHDLKEVKDKEEKGGEKVDMKEAFKEIAESFSVEPSVVEKMYDTFTKLTGGKKEVQISPELEKKIGEIDTTKQQLTWQYEDRQYIKEFKRDVLPVLKKRYPDISRTEIVKAMRKLHTLAFSEEYHLVPKVKSVFLGNPEEFNFLEGKKGGEGGKSAGTAKKGGKDLTHELSDEQIDKLTDEEFDTYTENMAKLTGGPKFRKVYVPKPK